MPGKHYVVRTVCVFDKDSRFDGARLIDGVSFVLIFAVASSEK
jgi:hypothetical protein